MHDDPNRIGRYDRRDLQQMLSHGRGHGEMFVELYLDAAHYAALTTDLDDTTRSVCLPLEADLANERLAVGFMGAALALLDAAERYQQTAEPRSPDGDDQT